jgi:acetylornithine deacetylase/succinyl-diaminopimelate desuccinylase-like protein
MSQLDAVLARLEQNREAALGRLFDFLKIQSISTDPAFAGECRKAAEWVKAELASIGIVAEVKPTGGHPAVTARVEGAIKRHALFYGHYDVQPVDPLNLWDTSPFEPIIAELPDGRKVIRARGSADDKGQIMTFIEACRAYKEVVGSLPIGVTFLIEGEEEDGSKHLPAFVEAEKAALKADVALVCDTSMWDRNTPQITSSLRGMVYEELTIKAADRDLHSGLFGGGAQNPIRVLTKILADLHDADGRVTLQDFYDGVPETPSQVLAQWDTLGLTAEEFLGGVGLSEPAGEKGRRLIEMIQSRPTCDVNGIIGGYTGIGAKTVIAAEASAKVSFRLVGNQDPAKIRDAFHAHVRARLPKDCSVEFISHKGSPALALPFDMPDLVAAKTALQDEWGVAPVTLGSGGSIPIVGDFKRILGLDTLLIGFGLDDDRIHSPNEKYDLTSFEKGARSWARILAALAG